VHVSAISHTPPDARHDVVADLNASVGQSALLPVHFSAVSHVPAEDLHVVVADFNKSDGQTALLPVHFSAESQVPAEARQTVEEDATGYVWPFLQISTVHRLPSLGTVTLSSFVPLQSSSIPLQLSALAGLIFASLSLQSVPPHAAETYPSLSTSGHVMTMPPFEVHVPFWHE
jgi:hypothetical protein